MKKFLIVGMILYFLCITQAQTQTAKEVSALNVQVYNFPFCKFLFFNADTIFGAGSYGVWKLDVSQGTGGTPSKIYDISWVDAFIKLSPSNWIVFSTAGATCLSTDGGRTWVETRNSPLCLLDLQDGSFLGGGVGPHLYRITAPHIDRESNWEIVADEKVFGWNTPQTILRSPSGRIFVSASGLSPEMEGIYFTDDIKEWKKAVWNYEIFDPYSDAPFTMGGDGRGNLLARDKYRVYFSTDDGETWQKWPYEKLPEIQRAPLGRIIYSSLWGGYVIAAKGGIMLVSNFSSPPRYIPIEGFPEKFMGMTERGEKVYLSYGGEEAALLELSPVISGISGESSYNFYLFPNYPNPFNSVTKINFSIAKPSNVKLTVYNILGQKVVTLVDKLMNAGVYSVDFDASNLAAGVYLYGIEAGDFKAYKKMVLLK